MATEAYARVNNRIARSVCVTTGRVGQTHLRGCWAAGWILYRCLLFPVRCVMTRRRVICSSLQMNAHRAVGDQEFDITKAAASVMANMQ